MNYCPHKLNPVACLQCFHAKDQARPREQPKPKAGLAQPLNPVLNAVKQRAVEDFRREYGRTPSDAELSGEPMVPIRVGFEPDGTPIQAEKPFKGPMPKPVVTPQVGAQAAGGTRVMEPYSYANERKHTKEITIAGQKQTIEVSRRRGELIDSLPRHPNSAR